MMDFTVIGRIIIMRNGISRNIKRYDVVRLRLSFCMFSTLNNKGGGWRNPLLEQIKYSIMDNVA